jgi:hypothetical protein
MLMIDDRREGTLEQVELMGSVPGGRHVRVTQSLDFEQIDDV